MEQAKAAPSGANAPYKIKKRGDKFVVVNNTGETKASFDSRDKALAYQRALYVNVRGATKRAAKTKFSGKARNRVKAAMTCPCGLGIEFDQDNGYQHTDGSISHDDGMSVSEKLTEAGLSLVPAEMAKGPNATAKDKDPNGGLSAAGRKKFGVKKGVTNYSGASDEDKKRWVRWALRFTKTPRPLKDDNGKPTRYALMFQAWGESIPTSTSAVSAVHSKAISRRAALGMGQDAKEKAELWDETFFPHQMEGDFRCELCLLPESASEHAAYNEIAYAEAVNEVPKHPFVAGRSVHSPSDGRYGFGAPRSKECVVCGMPNSHPLHDDEPTVVSPASVAPGGAKDRVHESQYAAAAVTCADCGKQYFTDEAKPVHKDCPEKAEYTGSGCMVAIYPDGEGLAGIKTSGDLPLEAQGDMHVTLVYLRVTPEGEELDLLKSVVQDMARTEGPLTGVWGGTARFNPSEGSDGKPVLVALPDLPDLSDFREDLVDALEAAGFKPAMNHGYTPHLTVAYDDNGQVRAEGPLTFGTLTLKTKGERFDYPFTDEIDMDAEAAAMSEQDIGKIAQGIDAAVDDALTHLRSCADLPPYALQAQAVLQGIEPACDELLDYFGVSDADDDPESDSEKSRELAKTKKHKHHFVGAHHLHPSVVHGAGYFGGCYACGRGAEDEAHEGAVEDEGPSSSGGGAPASGGAAGGGAEGAAMVDAHKDAENSQIEMNKKTMKAKGPHAFIPTTYAVPNKCLMCGSTAPETGGVCSGTGNVDPMADGAKAVLPGARITARIEQVRDRAFVQAESKALPTERAFVTEVAGRTILTGPAETLQGIEKAMTPNQHFLWMQGRFVGAEKANRNGAFWSTKDLELGEPTVRYGPLNWLHEAKHIIGTLADQRLVMPTTEQAAEGQSPHIFTLSPIWKWIYPDEAYVVEAASDSGKLWYSMECVSKDVVCVGDNGCGTTVPYMEYLQARPGTQKACQHLRERSSTRQFSEPTFLGGAVIVPPVRPGWGEADATVLRQAAAYAEDSYEQAGRPQMSATEWEHVMADVLRFASL